MLFYDLLQIVVKKKSQMKLSRLHMSDQYIEIKDATFAREKCSNNASDKIPKYHHVINSLSGGEK